ncbi:rod shape-determining protein MreC [bacterium]|nr:rod shape-determining protein MreC [bacterium]
MKFRPKIKIGFLLTLGVLILIILNSTSITKGIKSFIYSISFPVQDCFWQIGEKVSDFFTAFLRADFLQKENEELSLKLKELISENIKLKYLAKENETLRKALKIDLQKEFNLELVEIIGKDISEDFILINKGKKDGISEGLAVITAQKVLVGRISNVYENFSKVVLISNKESSFDAEILEKNITGVVRGRGNFQLSLDYLPKEKEITPGELVITTSLSKIYPKGLLVGEIKSVKKEDIEPFQKAEVSPAFEMGKEKYLFIIQE